MAPLIWINGPFGGGKTQTAYELRRRLPGSVICDPEHPGFGLHRMMPPGLRGDFQDLRSWRHGVREVLDLALRGHDSGPVIAPMTLVHGEYFEEIVGRLREEGHTVHHFALLAERATVLRRLRERGLVRGLRSCCPTPVGAEAAGASVSGVVVGCRRSASTP
ncbi:AAA family ATPase, partial [Streptomyces sp. NPDC048301]|uniref:AAA family ATPase n=1 Tax=Streptomyces sp. NPDC048301 TaxID=3155631 RepID=UPI00343FA7AC